MSTKIDSRIFLTLMWVLFFLVNMSLIFLLKINHWIDEESDDFVKALGTINSAYSPYLGVILLYFWTIRSKKSFPFDTSFFLAIIMSFIWNMIIFSLLFQLLRGSGDFYKNLSLINDVCGLFSWLVAGSIGLYFGNES